MVNKEKKKKPKRAVIAKSVLSMSVLSTQTPSLPLPYYAKAKQLSIPTFRFALPIFLLEEQPNKRRLQHLSNVPVSF